MHKAPPVAHGGRKELQGRASGVGAAAGTSWGLPSLLRPGTKPRVTGARWGGEPGRGAGAVCDGPVGTQRRGGPFHLPGPSRGAALVRNGSSLPSTTCTLSRRLPIASHTLWDRSIAPELVSTWLLLRKVREDQEEGLDPLSSPKVLPRELEVILAVWQGKDARGDFGQDGSAGRAQHRAARQEQPGHGQPCPQNPRPTPLLSRPARSPTPRGQGSLLLIAGAPCFEAVGRDLAEETRSDLHPGSIIPNQRAASPSSSDREGAQVGSSAVIGLCRKMLLQPLITSREGNRPSLWRN